MEKDTGTGTGDRPDAVGIADALRIAARIQRARQLFARVGMPTEAVQGWVDLSDVPWTTCWVMVAGGLGFPAVMWLTYAAGGKLTALTASMLAVNTVLGILLTGSVWYLGPQTNRTLWYKVGVTPLTVFGIYLLWAPFFQQEVDNPFENRFVTSICIAVASTLIGLTMLVGGSEMDSGPAHRIKTLWSPLWTTTVRTARTMDAVRPPIQPPEHLQTYKLASKFGRQQLKFQTLYVWPSYADCGQAGDGTTLPIIKDIQCATH